jgi:hypothetical protein
MRARRGQLRRAGAPSTHALSVAIPRQIIRAFRGDKEAAPKTLRPCVFVASLNDSVAVLACA